MKFGPAIIGEEEFKRQQEEREKAAHIFGPAVTGKHPYKDPPKEAEEAEEKEAEPTSEQDPPKEAVPTLDGLTVAQVRSALAGNDAMVDPLLEVELAKDAPRKSALKSILEAEMSREPNPRPEVVAQIEAKLAELG